MADSMRRVCGGTRGRLETRACIARAATSIARAARESLNNLNAEHLPVVGLRAAR